MAEPRTVLVTRPEPGATETAGRLASRGLVPVIAPMLEIRPLPGPPPPQADAILLTSRNGLIGLASLDAPVFAVGAATAEAARARGARDVTSAEGSAEDLAALVCARLPPGSSLLLPTARGQGGSLAAALRRAGYAVHLRHAYESRPADDLPPAAAAALAGGRVDFALFFSAETARAFVGALHRAGLETTVDSAVACAISPPVAVALGGLAWRHVRVAARPNQDALLALIE